MAKEKSVSQRDMTLINILERLSDQSRLQDARLEKIEKNQIEISAAAERAESQKSARHDESSVALDSLQKELLRYRSDMLSIVHEQDRLDERMKGLNKLQGSIATAQENIDRDLSYLRERFALQEKTVRESYEYSVRQGEKFTKTIADSDNHITKLHMDTEKHFIESHRETKRQIDMLRNETMHRLQAFDGIESALQLLIARTEPQEKKPFILVRVFRSVVVFFHYKLPGLFKKLPGLIKRH